MKLSVPGAKVLTAMKPAIRSGISIDHDFHSLDTHHPIHGLLVSLERL